MLTKAPALSFNFQENLHLSSPKNVRNFNLKSKKVYEQLKRYGKIRFFYKNWRVLKCDLVSVLAGSVSFSFASLNLGMALRDDAGIKARAQTLIFFM